MNVTIVAMVLGAAALCLVSVVDAAHAVAGRPTGVVVVEPRTRTWRSAHAAAELARTIRRMTGAPVTIVVTPPPASDRRARLILSIGPGSEPLRRLPGSSDADRLRDGFVIESRGPACVRISATCDTGLLYGAYEYLERFCGVGFFWDGDRVPRRAHLPLRGICLVSLPRWPLRHFGLADGWGLAKFHHHFRTAGERKRILDWMAKRKINLSHVGLFPSVATSGVPAKQVFGIDDSLPDPFTYSGWPGALDLPAERVTERLKTQLAFGRQRGIRWIYYLAYGNLPHQFRQTHPEHRYVGSLGYDATVLYPDDPACTQWMRRFYGELLRTYGTDHIYQDTPFVESTGASDPEQSFTLKLKAAQRMCALYKEMDPKAVWQSDSWDMGAVPQVWTAERIARYFNALPKTMMRVYDTAADVNPFYERTNYFEGADWAFGILHSFQGDDHLHGDMPGILAKLQSVSKDPKADRCRGIYHVPESNGHNLLYFELTTRAAWDPDGLKLDQFLADYAERRYGSANAAVMTAALAALVKAVYSGGGATPIYKKLGCGYGPQWWPIVGARKVAAGLEPAPRELNDLIAALDLATSCKPAAWKEGFYVTDLVDWTRTALAYACNWKTLDAYRALRQGDAVRAAASAASASEGLRRIEDLLSTRPEFSLQTQIASAMVTPGVNPHAAMLMKKHCVNDLYSANEVYEQMHWYYRPRMEVYLGELLAHTQAGVRSIEWADIASRCAEIEKRWLEKEIAVPAGERTKQTTRQLIEAAHRWLKEQR
jgi:hypothetical protein